MSGWLLWPLSIAGTVLLLVAVLRPRFLLFWTCPKPRPVVDLVWPRLPGNPVYRLEHECWPDQTVEWFGHDDRCATCGARRLGVPNHLDNPLWKPGRLLPHVSPTPAEVDYWLTGLGTREQINAAGYEAVSVTELGSAETRYVKGRRLE